MVAHSYTVLTMDHIVLCDPFKHITFNSYKNPVMRGLLSHFIGEESKDLGDLISCPR